MTAMMLLIVLYQILYSQNYTICISELSALETEQDKIADRIKPLIERDNEELRKANQIWYEKYEELSAKNSDLLYEVRKMYCMLNTVIMIISTVLVSYSVVVYCHILAAV